ncbi:accessory gene regulator B family protein [uncultured Tyzzerella sp.]|uniref:accessory gene regulator ArgB-like protein n=1 Tax=uncultured Tyzzerella sp. TaxID=2321398 RepID=UPI002943651A|nr:accessory gene regulator B family protein [uncultured Tyzzerella sp.]
MEVLTKRLINNLINNNIIKKEDEEIYSYGFNQIVFVALNLITTLVIGVVFNKTFESILFMFTYIPIRVYAGGYHARTKLGCYIFSVLMLISVCYILKLNLLQNSLLIIILSIVSSGIILYLAPIEDKNKLLDEIEIKVYKKRTIRNLTIVLIVLCITLIFNKINLSSCIFISLLCNGIMLMLGKISNSVRYKYSK